MINLSYFKTNNTGLYLKLYCDVARSKVTSIFQKVVKVESQLMQNIRLAEEGITYTRSHVLLSYTFPNQTGTLFQHTDDQTEKFNELRSAVKMTRKIALDEFNALPDSQKDLLHETLIRAKYAEKYSIGNCHEHSAVLFSYLLLKQVPKFGIWYIQNGDHVFVIIGEGEDAIVADPWSLTCYPLSELNDHLYDYVRVDEASKQPVLAPFDPTTQKIINCVSKG